MSGHTPDFRFVCRHESVKRHLLLLFPWNISDLGDAFNLPRSLDDASTTREYFILPPPFFLLRESNSRQGNIDLGFLVPEMHRILSLASAVFFHFVSKWKKWHQGTRLWLVCWKLVRPRFRTCIGAFPWPGTKANMSLDTRQSWTHLICLDLSRHGAPGGLNGRMLLMNILPPLSLSTRDPCTWRPRHMKAESPIYRHLNGSWLCFKRIASLARSTAILTNGTATCRWTRL